MLKLIDSHCHLNFEAFREDRDLVLENSLKNGVGVINIGSQFETSREAIKLAEKYEGEVFAVVGLHPIHIGKRIRDKIEEKLQEEVDEKSDEEIFNKIKNLKSEKIVAIGETGLDYFHLSQNNQEKTKKEQAKFFREHIKLAKENNLPLVLHCREAYHDLMKILKEEKVSRAVVHCFSGRVEEAGQILDLGLYIGFTGIITFKNAKELQDAARKIPLERILVETDAPYLAPEPCRGKRNLPIYVQFVAKKIAELKGLPWQEVFQKTLENTIKLFNLK